MIAAASLVMDDYHRRGKRARFRILHSERVETAIYGALLGKLRIAAQAVDGWFLFVKDGHPEQMRCVKELGFLAERQINYSTCHMPIMGTLQ